MTGKSRLFAFVLAVFGVLGIGDAFAVQYGNCHWDGTAPICRGRCENGFVQVKIESCLSGHKAYCCEILGTTTSDGPGQPYLPATRHPANFCPTGTVWRERFDGDTVCVLPAERDANRRQRGLPVGAGQPANFCPTGTVWRERFDGDTVCVLPAERDANRRQRGLPVGAGQPANFCPTGLVWRERFDGDTVCVLPGERDANRRQRGLPVGAASTCPSGLVWREQFDGDTVCVTPIEREKSPPPGASRQLRARQPRPSSDPGGGGVSTPNEACGLPDSGVALSDAARGGAGMALAFGRWALKEGE